jgi:hypothetical protein
MTRTRTILLYAVLLLLTIGYSWLVDLGIVAFRQYLALRSLDALPLPSLWLSMRPLPWQLLAFVSLLLHSLWARHGERRGGDGRHHLYAAVLHCAWILLCLILHALGMLLPFVARVPVID